MTAYWMKTCCRAKIRSLVSGAIHYGECTHLSVDGIVIRSSYVPQFAERLEITMLPTVVGACRAAPFVTETEVRHCQMLECGDLVEFGVLIKVRRS